MISNNILYTKKGDDGTTTLYNCEQGRLSKSSTIIEGLGSVDELNAYLGVVKTNSDSESIFIDINKNKRILFKDIISEIQQTLFVIQAEIAGSNISVIKTDLNKIEKYINIISVNLPKIKSFTVSGGTKISAELDYTRTLSRRSERRIVEIKNKENVKIGKITLTYLNRLSSLLFAMSRYSNFITLTNEEHPTYYK